ncbi:hypothetical protein [Marinifilum breve]|nr:hypothetical protein [Marinifilum breve]
MKKYYTLILFILANHSLYSQTNIFEKDGNVGIGTTNPNYRLHVVGKGMIVANDIYNMYFIPKSSNYQNNTSSIIAKDRPLSITTDAHRDIYFSTFYSGQGLDVKMTIKGDGKVGIGTDKPSSRLSVYGGIAKLTTTGYDHTFDNFIKYGHKSDLESGSARVNRWHGIDATITAGAAASNKMKFRLYAGGYGNEAPIDVMTLAGDGNVGIGTISPNHKLDVKGTIRTQELKVDMQGADFVFEEDYQLRSLEEVEDFVKENKHLPDVAPAKEMQENGVNQSEMNQKLLQKIEELTLYVIEIKKEVKTLKKENLELKKQINHD